MQESLTKIAVTVARVDERTKDLPELKRRVDELHTHVMFTKGERAVVKGWLKWSAGIMASFIIAGGIAAVGYIFAG